MQIEREEGFCIHCGEKIYFGKAEGRTDLPPSLYDIHDAAAKTYRDNIEQWRHDKTGYSGCTKTYAEPMKGQ